MSRVPLQSLSPYERGITGERACVCNNAFIAPNRRQFCEYAATKSLILGEGASDFVAAFGSLA